MFETISDLNLNCFLNGPKFDNINKLSEDFVSIEMYKLIRIDILLLLLLSQSGRKK